MPTRIAPVVLLVVLLGMNTTSSMQVWPGSRAVLAASVSSLLGFGDGRDRGDRVQAVEDPAGDPDQEALHCEQIDHRDQEQDRLDPRIAAHFRRQPEHADSQGQREAVDRSDRWRWAVACGASSTVGCGSLLITRAALRRTRGRVTAAVRRCPAGTNEAVAC